MSLLDFARGPGLKWSLAIMVLGIAWRLVGTFLILRRRDLSTPRDTGTLRAGLRAIVTRSAPAHELEKVVRFQHYTGYAWHIGLFVSVLFFVPHIAFFKSILGFGWPGLPNNIVIVAAAITIAILITLLVRRLFHPVLRLISSAEDYISILIVILPFVTGMMAHAHIGLKYPDMLAVHILSVELLFIWVPFGKLMHTFLWLPSRAQIGAAFQRRGVRA